MDLKVFSMLLSSPAEKHTLHVRQQRSLWKTFLNSALKAVYMMGLTALLTYPSHVTTLISDGSILQETLHRALVTWTTKKGVQQARNTPMRWRQERGGDIYTHCGHSHKAALKLASENGIKDWPVSACNQQIKILQMPQMYTQTSLWFKFSKFKLIL